MGWTGEPAGWPARRRSIADAIRVACVQGKNGKKGNCFSYTCNNHTSPKQCGAVP